MSEAFQPRGAVSCKAACLEVFRGMAVGDWVFEGDLLHRVNELTGVEFSSETVKSSAWAAREALVANSEIGVEYHMKGYKRLDVMGQVAAVEKRGTKARKAGRRTVTWGTSALANPALPPEQRHAVQAIVQANVRQDAIDASRASRRRPAVIEQAASDV